MHWPGIGPANHHNTPSIITQHRQTDRERQRETERERERERATVVTSLIGFVKSQQVVVLGAGHAHLEYGHNPGPQPTAGEDKERGTKPRHLRALHHLGVERKCEAVAAGLEHPHIFKKACVTASAQCVP